MLIQKHEMLKRSIKITITLQIHHTSSDPSIAFSEENSYVALDDISNFYKLEANIE